MRLPQCVTVVLCCALPVLAVTSIAAEARGDFPPPVESRSYRPFSEVELTSYVFDHPRPLRAWSLRIDVTSPAVDMVVSAPNAEGPKFETRSATTLEFARERNAQIAVNGTPFLPSRDRSGAGTDVLGLAAADGLVFSEADPLFGALVCRKDGTYEIYPAQIDAAEFNEVDQAVGGFGALVIGGRNVSDRTAARLPTVATDQGARTAVGLSADKGSLWLMIVDGGQPGHSEGLTYSELADFAVMLGCDRALHLDWAASTTLVVQNRGNGEWRVVNAPVWGATPGALRPVGLSFGFTIASGGRSS